MFTVPRSHGSFWITNIYFHGAITSVEKSPRMIFESIIKFMSHNLTCCVLIDFKRPIQNILPYLDQQRLGRDQELTRLLAGVLVAFK